MFYVWHVGYRYWPCDLTLILSFVIAGMLTLVSKVALYRNHHDNFRCPAFGLTNRVGPRYTACVGIVLKCKHVNICHTIHTSS
jgi:hypothetical protein